MRQRAYLLNTETRYYVEHLSLACILIKGTSIIDIILFYFLTWFVMSTCLLACFIGNEGNENVKMMSVGIVGFYRIHVGKFQNPISVLKGEKPIY